MNTEQTFRKVNIVFVLMFMLLFSCQKSRHKWQFEVKNECRFLDAFINTSFKPVRYKIFIKGNLSDSSTLRTNIHGNNSNTMTSGSITIPSGKVDYSGGGDIYQENMTLIYTPGREMETVGKLVIDVEIY